MKNITARYRTMVMAAIFLLSASAVDVFAGDFSLEMQLSYPGVERGRFSRTYSALVFDAILNYDLHEAGLRLSAGANVAISGRALPRQTGVGDYLFFSMSERFPLRLPFDIQPLLTGQLRLYPLSYFDWPRNFEADAGFGLGKKLAEWQIDYMLYGNYTVDQSGWYYGWQITRDAFEGLGGLASLSADLFWARDYQKQDHQPFLPQLFAGNWESALTALIPLYLSLGAQLQYGSFTPMTTLHLLPYRAYNQQSVYLEFALQYAIP